MSTRVDTAPVLTGFGTKPPHSWALTSLTFRRIQIKLFAVNFSSHLGLLYLYALGGLNGFLEPFKSPLFSMEWRQMTLGVGV